MEIKLSPQRRDGALVLSREGETLTINGTIVDMSTIGEGAEGVLGDTLCEGWIVGEVTRSGGHLSLTIVLPHGPTPSDAVAFPAPIIDPPDGPITLPT